MKVTNIIKLIPGFTDIIIGHNEKGTECFIGKDAFDCEYSDDENQCEDCEHLIENYEFWIDFKGKCRDAPIKLADRTVLGLDIITTRFGRGKKAETTISLKIITRELKEG